jgi:hypothetical protein
MWIEAGSAGEAQSAARSPAELSKKLASSTAPAGDPATITRVAAQARFFTYGSPVWLKQSIGFSLADQCVEVVEWLSCFHRYQA